MTKIAMIGAGSVVFSKNLTGDILAFPELADATLCYMDVNKERLDTGVRLCQKVAKKLGATPTIQGTLDRREALKDADFVINMVQIGGFDSTLVDFEIPKKYGLPFTIADTTGPGGLFRALRTYPMIKGLCQDMEDLCPNATLLNYSNPMSMNMQTIYRTSGIQAVGLCHSVQGTFNQLMRYIGEEPEDMSFICAGINHMAFYLSIKKDGVDMYPRLFEAMNEPKTYASNKVRFELMKRLGRFITESSEHNAEYCPFFIPHGQEMIDRFDVPIDEYLRRCDSIIESFNQMIDFSKSDEEIEVHRSHEYGSLIIHSMVTGTPRVVYGNQPNGGSITNLPKTAIVEVPTLVDRAGLQQTHVGELPAELVGYMQPHITQHELFIQAAMNGRRDHVYQACMYDPLTASMLTLDQITEMCDEMIAAHGDLLPPLDNSPRVPSSGKQFEPITDFTGVHASWDARKPSSHDEPIRDWQLIGPFDGSKGEGNIMTVATPIEDGGRLPEGFEPTPVTVDGKELAWEKVHVRVDGFVNLHDRFADTPSGIAYAYGTIDCVHARETQLLVGSWGGVRVWINGDLVQDQQSKRRHRSRNDSVDVRLNEGTNTIVVKVAQVQSRWGFDLAFPRPTS